MGQCVSLDGAVQRDLVEVAVSSAIRAFCSLEWQTMRTFFFCTLYSTSQCYSFVMRLFHIMIQAWTEVVSSVFIPCISHRSLSRELHCFSGNPILKIE